jgi:hypothetical protein
MFRHFAGVGGWCWVVAAQSKGDRKVGMWIDWILETGTFVVKVLTEER